MEHVVHSSDPRSRSLVRGPPAQLPRRATASLHPARRNPAKIEEPLQCSAGAGWASKVEIGGFWELDVMMIKHVRSHLMLLLC